MIDITTILITVGIISVEIAVLVVLYKKYITNWNADKWVEKASDGNWMEGLLRPIIDVLVTESTDSIAQRMKMELLSSQGVMSKQVLANIDVENPEEALMNVSQSLLQSIGYKNPNPIITMKLAQGMGGLMQQVMDKNGVSNRANSASVKTGADIFKE